MRHWRPTAPARGESTPPNRDGGLWDFAAVARSYGLRSVVVDRMAELDQAVRLVFAHDGPALITARIHRHEVMQSTQTIFERMTKAALSATHAVLSGHADELVELERTSLHELALS